MNLFVAKLNPVTTTKDLQKLFSHYGLVTTVKVIFDHGTGRSKCYGFIEMPNDHEAQEALKELDNTSFQENLITVRESQPPEVQEKRNGQVHSFRNRDNTDYKGNGAWQNRVQQEDFNRRNFGYRGSSYRNSL